MLFHRTDAAFPTGVVRTRTGGEKIDNIPAFGGVQLICCGDFFQLPPIIGKVPLQTWPRLDAASLKRHSAVLQSGLENKPEELFLNRGFAFQVRPCAVAPHMPPERVGLGCARASMRFAMLIPAQLDAFSI